MTLPEWAEGLKNVERWEKDGEGVIVRRTATHGFFVNSKGILTVMMLVGDLPYIIFKMTPQESVDAANSLVTATTGVM